MKPPSFLSKTIEKKKKEKLLSIEVSITPSRQGRLAIMEGDDIKKTAASFCKAYQLGKEMENTLVAQLERHMKNYYTQKTADRIIMQQNQQVIANKDLPIYEESKEMTEQDISGQEESHVKFEN
jgi:hypothetical protein